VRPEVVGLPEALARVRVQRVDRGLVAEQDKKAPGKALVGRVRSGVLFDALKEEQLGGGTRLCGIRGNRVREVRYRGRR
jgi:hypothetical protein